MSETFEILKRLAKGEPLLDILGYSSFEELVALDPNIIAANSYRNPDKSARIKGDLIYAYLANMLSKEIESATPSIMSQVRALWEAQPNLSLGWKFVKIKLGVKDDDALVVAELSLALNELAKEGWLIQRKNGKGHLVYERPTKPPANETARQAFLRHEKLGTLKCGSLATYYRRIKGNWDFDTAAITP